MSTTSWYWPLPGYTEDDITSGVGPRWGSTHKGIDIAAPRGTEVVATRAGEVIDVYNSCNHDYGKPDANDPNGCGGGYGNRVYIDHKDGYVSRYAHLSEVKVSKGQRVSAGQVIGTVGSTGDSTGFHLHFEIRSGDTYKDPEIYVSSDNTKRVASTDTNVSNTTVSSLDDGPTFIVGRRVSDTTTQPMHAYVHIYAGGELLSPKPNMVQNFEMTRFMGAGDTANFVLFDDTWDRLEQIFSAYWNDIKLVYGYANTDISSPDKHMTLQEYSLSFNSTGTFLTASAICHGVVDNMNPITLVTDERNPTRAVIAICKYMGWKVIPQNFDETLDIPDAANPFNISNDYPVTYIKNEIIPFAQTAEGELLDFYLDSDDVAYFKAEGFTAPTDTSNIRTYIHQKGYDSPIIDLTFDVKGFFGGASELGIASGASTSVFDPVTKEESTRHEDITTVVTSATGESIHMSAAQSVPSVGSAGYSPTQTKNKLYYDVKKKTTSHYEATMVIVGDPTITLLESIRIINVTDAGYLHHTSGIYMINSIVDQVSDGQMTTTLKLIRNGTGNINEGVEIISPKVLVK